MVVKECAVIPVIDGKTKDECWSKAEWHPIDQVWVPWGEAIDPLDFSGKFKVTWSSATDKLYFLVEIVDDILVEGYEFPDKGYWGWDVVEIFIDEDASGGPHARDANAFAYHVTTGNMNSAFDVLDLSSRGIENYSNHLECKVERNNSIYTWEISMIVYNENFDPERVINSHEKLEHGKIIGLSLAYCDNDDKYEVLKIRDNFIGSVKLSQDKARSHWKEADDFGRFILIGNETSDHGKK